MLTASFRLSWRETGRLASTMYWFLYLGVTVTTFCTGVVPRVKETAGNPGAPGTAAQLLAGQVMVMLRVRLDPSWFRELNQRFVAGASKKMPPEARSTVFSLSRYAMPSRGARSPFGVVNLGEKTNGALGFASGGW